MKQAEIFKRENILLKLPEWQEQFGVFAGFSTRNGGKSEGLFQTLNLSFTVGDTTEAILRNRQLLADCTPVPYEHWVFAEQKHTSNIQEITKEHVGAGTIEAHKPLANTDGMYTRERDVMLSTMHADCTPIYFYAPKQKIIGLAHAGWQGTVNGITANMLAAWQALGVDLEDVYIAIGPSASQALYEVDEPVIAQVRKMGLPLSDAMFTQKDNGKYLLDTGHVNFVAAVQAGVPAENIIRSAYCTIRDQDLFFSYRRDGQTGRMLAFISQ